MGMIIVGVIIIYCIAGLIVSILAYKFTKKIKYSILVLIFFALLPTWDLLIQKAVKEYYVTFKMEPKIYAYPQRDENGKIESLGLIDVTNWTQRELDNKVLLSRYKKKVKDFIEITFYKSYNHAIGNKANSELLKINFNNMSITKIQKSQAKYAYKMVIKNYKIVKFYELKFINTKNNQVLGKSFSISFPDTFSFFRKNFLFLVTGNGQGLLHVGSIGGYGNLLKLKKELKLK